MVIVISFNMKSVVIFTAILSLAFSAPQQTQHFHEHVDEFLDIIMEEARDKLEQLFVEYLQFEEFWMTLECFNMAELDNFINEMDSFPEFKAATAFLEKHNIDIRYFIEIFNEVLEQTKVKPTHQVPGKTFRSFIADSIAELPKSKLSALFDQKMKEDVVFRTTIENFQSEEWCSIWDALWENETFETEAQIFEDKCFDLFLLLDDIMAIFGKNKKYTSNK